MDHRLTYELGDDVHVVLDVEPERMEEENRYSAIKTVFSLDLSGLSEDELVALKKKVDGAVERNCTVGRTLEASAENTYEFKDSRNSST